MYNLVKPLLIREELVKRKIRIFTYQEFAQIFKLSPYQAEYSLKQLTEEKLVSRLKKGFYTLKIDPPSEQEVANALYKPSYISFDYALAYYGIIPEMVYTVTSATTKPTRLFTTNNLAFSYNTIKPGAYTGYKLMQQGDRRFQIAEPEKALVDYLYQIALGQRSNIGARQINDRLNLSSLNKKIILAYAKLYNLPKLNTVIKELL